MKDINDKLREIEDSWYLHLQKSDKRRMLLQTLYECDEGDFDVIRNGLENDIKEAIKEVDDG